MNFRRLLVIVIVGCLTSAGCQRAAGKPTTKTEPAAKVATIAQESKLNLIELSPAAEQRLGIRTEKVTLRKIPLTRTLAGEVTLPVGASLIVSAPVGGTLRLPAATRGPRIGTPVKARQPVFLLTPLLTPEARLTLLTGQADADGQVQSAEVRLAAAQETLKLAEKGRREGVRTVQELNDAKALVEVAQKTLATAQQVKNLRDKMLEGEGGASSDAEVIESPQDGIVRALHVVAGEKVAGGAPLFEVLDLSKVWIRVPVYVGELAEVAPDETIQISSLSDKAGAPTLVATPVAAPPTATPLSSTADLYYELDNPGGKLRPGEKVRATLVLQGARESLAIPYSAIIHDIHGGTWVYERTAPQSYVRRRVELKAKVRQEGIEYAVLGASPAAGAEVVVEAVAELYGTEFGFGK